MVVDSSMSTPAYVMSGISGLLAFMEYSRPLRNPLAVSSNLALAGLFGYGGYQIKFNKNYKSGNQAVLLASTAMTGMMGYRYFQTKNLYPAGITAGLGALTGAMSYSQLSQISKLPAAQDIPPLAQMAHKVEETKDRAKEAIRDKAKEKAVEYAKDAAKEKIKDITGREDK